MPATWSVPAAVACLLAAAALPQLHSAAAQKVVLYDNFTAGCPPNANWDTPSRQWGGTINGGTVPGNVKCAMDSTLGKQVLVLESHGDQFTGTGPVGITHNGSPRGPTDEFTDWKNPGALWCTAQNWHAAVLEAVWLHARAVAVPLC